MTQLPIAPPYAQPISAAEFMATAPPAMDGSSPWAQLTLPSGHVALFDEADRRLVELCRWHALKGRHTFYVQTKGNAAAGIGRTYLHRLLVGAGADQLVDHRNLNGLDNRRANLRLCTPGQNNLNSPARNGYRGVEPAPHNKTKPWRARIARRHLGYFANEWDAAEAFNVAAVALYGEFALLNVQRVAA